MSVFLGMILETVFGEMEFIHLTKIYFLFVKHLFSITKKAMLDVIIENMNNT